MSHIKKLDLPDCQDDCRPVCTRMSSVYGKIKHWSIYERNQWKDPQKLMRWAGQTPSMAEIMSDDPNWKTTYRRK